MRLSPTQLGPDCSGERSLIFIFKKRLPKNIIFIQSVITSFLAALIILSCSNMSLDTYTGPQYPIYKESPQAPGFMVYIKPFLNDIETKRYFGVNLLKNNILAVYVSASNTNPCKNYISTEDSIKITQNISKGSINHPQKGSEDSATTAASLGIGTAAASIGVAAVTFPAYASAGALLAVPIVVYGLPLYLNKKMSDASIIKEHFETQKYRATTLETGEKASGFIYFNWNDLKKYNEVSLCLIITDAVSNEMYYPCFDVSLQMSEDE